MHIACPFRALRSLKQYVFRNVDDCKSFSIFLLNIAVAFSLLSLLEATVPPIPSNRFWRVENDPGPFSEGDGRRPFHAYFKKEQMLKG
jgi:hypothetical protein